MQLGMVGHGRSRSKEKAEPGNREEAWLTTARLQRLQRDVSGGTSQQRVDVLQDAHCPTIRQRETPDRSPASQERVLRAQLLRNCCQPASCHSIPIHLLRGMTIAGSARFAP